MDGADGSDADVLRVFDVNGRESGLLSASTRETIFLLIPGIGQGAVSRKLVNPLLHQINTVMQKINIALVGDYNDNVTAHLAIPRALRITSKNGAVDIDAQWIATEDLDENTRLELRQYHGIWCVPASP